MVKIHLFADIEQDIGVVKMNITGERSGVIDSVPFSYQTYKYNGGYEHSNTRWCLVDRKGNVYVSDLASAPEELREQFQHLIAFHERLEFDWLKEVGLPAPRWSILHVDVSGAAAEIHSQVHYLELRAARDMGILDEYVKWRPHESVTNEFYEKLKAES